MQTRALVLAGLAVVSAQAGCQSYFPYGHGGTAPYSSIPPGTYGPPPGGAMPSSGRPGGPPYRPGSAAAPATGKFSDAAPLNNKSANDGSKSVPSYREPGSTPSNLGAAADDDGDEMKKPDGMSSRSGAGFPAIGDADDTVTTAFDEEGEDFQRPRTSVPASATSEDEFSRPTARRTASRSPSPFKYDKKNYRWLRGIVERDRRNNAWRMIYSRNPLDDDLYDGSLTLVDDQELDSLIEGEAYLIDGEVDASAPDRNGKPSYRAHVIKPIRPKED
jgi:hypothetical protein